jgi:pseudaminic acid cytidylyltransferase
MISASLAIIPARGGSKRIPRKNIRPFLDRPIIEYSIKAAIQSQCFDEIMVSTDDPEISSIAQKAGAKVPFFRSSDAASDHATLAGVVAEVLKTYSSNGRQFTHCCCILATAPFVTASDITVSYRKMLEAQADGIVSIVRYSYPIQRALRVVDDHIEMICPENMTARSNDLSPSYHDAGQFYWLAVDRFLVAKSLFMKNTIGFEISESRVQDIDTLEDWKIAEMKYQILRAAPTGLTSL